MKNLIIAIVIITALAFGVGFKITLDRDASEALEFATDKAEQLKELAE